MLTRHLASRSRDNYLGARGACELLFYVLVTVVIGEEGIMVNKIVVVNMMVHLGPPLCHCRGPLYKMVW